MNAGYKFLGHVKYNYLGNFIRTIQQPGSQESRPVRVIGISNRLLHITG